MKTFRLTQPVFLCGMMGAGKSATGKTLAEKLSIPFHDLDQLIEEAAGKTIPRIFSDEGETYFRKLERDILVKQSQIINGVMALGGGSLQNQQIVDHLKVCGWLVWLDAPVPVLAERIGAAGNRPLLSNGSDNDTMTVKLETLMKERELFYRQAHITLQTNGLNPGQTADQIIQKLVYYER